MSEAVKSVNVDAPSSKVRPFAKDISKSLTSKESLYGGSILKFSNAWFKIKSSVLPRLASCPSLSNLFLEFFLTHPSIKQLPGEMS